MTTENKKAYVLPNIKLNLRKEASPNAEIITELAPSAAVEIHEDTDRYFYKVKTEDGKTGFVRKNLVTMFPAKDDKNVKKDSKAAQKSDAVNS